MKTACEEAAQYMGDEMNDTPRTDTEAFAADDSCYDVVQADFARDLERENAALRAAARRGVEALRDFAMPKQSHYECEDGWYSCPAHPEYLGSDGSHECTCGADEHNARLGRHAEALRDAGVTK